MSEIVITPQKVKREFLILFICLLAVCLVNVGSIIAFKTPWSDIYRAWVWRETQFFLAGIYLLTVVIRLAISGARSLFGKKELQNIQSK